MKDLVFQSAGPNSIRGFVPVTDGGTAVFALRTHKDKQTKEKMAAHLGSVFLCQFLSL